VQREQILGEVSCWFAKAVHVMTRVYTN